MHSDAFKEGRKAFARGLNIGDCPYDKGTEAYGDWRGGWSEAYEEDEADYEDD